jgi:hypothetical protein
MCVQWVTRIQNTTSITVEWLVSNTGAGYSGYYWVRACTGGTQRWWHCVDPAQYSAFVIMISRLLLSCWQNRKEGKLQKSFAGTFVARRLVVLGVQKVICLLNWHQDYSHCSVHGNRWSLNRPVRPHGLTSHLSVSLSYRTSQSVKSRSTLTIHKTSRDEKVGGVSLKYNFVQDSIF